MDGLAVFDGPHNVPVGFLEVSNGVGEFFDGDGVFFDYLALFLHVP